MRGQFREAKHMAWILAFVLNLLSKGKKGADFGVKIITVASVLRLDYKGRWAQAVKPIRRPLSHSCWEVEKDEVLELTSTWRSS